MASSNMKNPPIFKENEMDYEEWKKDIGLWTLLTDLPKAKMAIAIHLSLNGRARKASSELTANELKADDGTKTLLEKLDRVFLQDANWRCFNNYLAFENCRREDETSIDKFLSEFDQRHYRLKESGVDLPDAVLACRLLKSCNLSDVHFQLALSTTPAMTFENMRKTLKRLFADGGIGCFPKDTGECSQVSSNIKVEPVMYSENFNSRSGYRQPTGARRPGASGRGGYYNSGGRYRRGGRRNPVGPDGRISKCHNCGSELHWSRSCPQGTARNTFYSGDRETGHYADDQDEEVKIILMANEEQNDKIDVLFGETIGAMILDLGCSKTVCGTAWLETYLETLDRNQLLEVTYEKSSSVFRFGDGKRMTSLKRAIIPCVLAGKNISIRTDIVECNIPLLLSKASMKKAGMIIDTNDDTVKVYDSKIKLGTTSIGHYKLFIAPPPSVARIEEILLSLDNSNPYAVASKLHKQFAHHSAEKVIKLLKDAGNENKVLHDSVEKVTATCETCIKHKRPRPRPVVSMPLGRSFNETVAMDLKNWFDVYFLVLVDIATRYCTAVVITNKKADTVVTALFTSWISRFGAPQNFFSDNGGEFDNDAMRCLGERFGVKLMNTAAEAPWSNGVCERLNCLLSISVQRIVSDTQCNTHIALAWAVAARNALQNNKGFSPNQLVFGYNPAFPNVLDSEPPALEDTTSSKIVADNYNAGHAARREFLKNESNEKIRRALSHQVREDNVAELRNGDSVYYKRNGETKWRGPGNVIGRDGKQVLVRHGGTYVRVHSCRLQRNNSSSGTIESPINVNNQSTQSNSSDKSHDSISANDSDRNSHDSAVANDCNDDDEDDNLDSEDNLNFIYPSRSMPSLKAGKRIEYLDENGCNNVVKVVSRAGKAGGVHSHCYNVQNQQGEIAWIDLSRNVQKWRPISDDEEIMWCSSGNDAYQAKLDELKKWIKNEVFEKVEDCGQNTVSARWVITEKPEDGVKARLVARGFEEDLDNRTDSPTCSKDSLRLSLALMKSFGWKCHTVDIKSAFLQGNKIERNVFIRPPKEFNDGCLWRLKKNVYGLNDAARAWYSRLKDVLLGLGMKISHLDLALFFWWHGNVLAGVMCIHVDDILWAGTPLFHTNVVEIMKQKLEVGKSCDGRSFKYISVNITQDDDIIGLHQNDYIDSLEEICLSRERASQRRNQLGKQELEEFRALVGQLNWLSTQTRPDVAFDVCELSTVVSNATVEDVIRANKVVKKVKQRNVTLQFKALDGSDGYSLECYSDASFGNLPGGGSQGGFVIFLVDSNGIKCPLTWQSKKVRRVVKSTLAAETLSLLDAAEAGIYMANLIGEILNLNCLPLVKCYVDNKSLVDSLYSTKQVDDKHLRINLAVLGDMLERGELSSVTWVQSARQLANVFTKRGASAELLLSAVAEANLAKQ